MSQKGLPCDDIHHNTFKLIAVGQKRSMKSMVHAWIDSGCIIVSKEQPVAEETK